MPITKSALKALRQDRRRALHNKPIRSQVKTSIDAAKKAKTTESLSGAFSSIDKAVKHNLVHKNKAARLKSALAKLLKA